MFHSGQGNDTITDFTCGEDVIHLYVDDGHLGVVNGYGPQGFDALTITNTDEGAAVITWGTEDSILLNGVDHTNLTADDFVF